MEKSMTLLMNPWFWAFLGACGWGLAPYVVGSAIGKKTWFGILTLILCEVPRVVFALPIIIQPRLFDPIPPWLTVLGGAVLLGSLAFASPVVRIIPHTSPNRSEPLRTDGLYAHLRHPLTLCDALWPLGYALMTGSIIGILLTPVWFALCWLVTTIEEERLVEEYGDDYREYQLNVPRLIPSLRPNRVTA
jgi:protein-S-isoprenylcysteine O-methyltransferase Ste14